MFVPSLALIACGIALLTVRGTRATFVASAVVFGLGFGTAYPTFAAYVMRDVNPRRRGAAFGAILAAFDTGIGTGSTTVGWLIRVRLHDGVRHRRGVIGDRAAVFPLVDRYSRDPNDQRSAEQGENTGRSSVPAVSQRTSSLPQLILSNTVD